MRQRRGKQGLDSLIRREVKKELKNREEKCRVEKGRRKDLFLFLENMDGREEE